MSKYQVDTADGHSYVVETEDGPVGEGVMGQGKGTPLEEAISPTGGEDNFLTSPHGFIRSGARQIVHGIGEVFSPGKRMQGASDVIRGAGSVMTPAAIPLAVANPVTAAIGIGSGMAAGKVARSGVQAMGGDEGAQNLGEDVAGLGAGVMAGGLSKPRLSPAIGAGIKAAAPSVIKGGAKVVGGEVLGQIPGMEWPARIGMGYPGARQIGEGLDAGMNATKDKFRQLKPSTPPQGPVKPPPIGSIPPEGQAPGPIGPVNRPQLSSGRTPGPVEQVSPTRYSPPQQELLDQVNGDFSSGPITKPSLPSGRQVGPAPVGPPMVRQGPQLPSTNRPQDIPVGPTPRPTLPSGRKVGAMGPETPQAGPVSAPGTSPLPNAPAPPGTSDVQPTQAAEFATPESKVPRPVGQAPPQPNQVQDPRLSRSSIQKHLEGISRKTENVKAFVSDPANQVTVEELESLKNDLTQAEDPAKYHSAIQKAKTMGKEVYVHAKGKGAPIPDSPYKTFSLDDIDTAIKALQSQK